jgi:hypothetical protein
LRVDEVRDGVVSETSERLRELRTRYIDSGIDQYFAVGRSQHRNVSATAIGCSDDLTIWGFPNGSKSDSRLILEISHEL